MTADTTQPAGALPEPCPEVYRLGWIRYTADQLRAMMAERDAAREKAADWHAAAESLNAEVTRLAQELDAREGREPQWISVAERVPALVNDEDVPVYTWDGKTVTEDTYGPEFDQPAGPMVGGWLRVGENFGDTYRTVTHWMARTIPAPPAGTSADGETQP